MNRRTVLGFAVTSALAGLAGCIEGVQEHFGFQGVIPVEIQSEAEETQNILLESRERESGRQSYEQSYSVTPGETVSSPHLDQTEQSFRVAKIENETMVTVRTVSVTPDANLVKIQLYDDNLVVEVRRDDGENEIADGEDEDGDGDGNETAGSNETDPDATGNETAANETDTDDDE
ncbi:hypothetical protein JMJ58_19665 [Haloterrigena salifodinae]|uniref:Uncharacterized protein n=1 Tax=Haloterrigena salifodinae TaxID=2675099 RepID=A0A8T8E038_9EURY|nr:hypothetical protein [Haloterrigena salifodinae]QRV15099.1 hypothetical protein JMJ58_19665 [Haloterrigena salifodinae]